MDVPGVNTEAAMLNLNTLGNPCEAGCVGQVLSAHTSCRRGCGIMRSELPSWLQKQGDFDVFA